MLSKDEIPAADSASKVMRAPGESISERRPRPSKPSDFALPIVLSLLIVGSSPAMGQIRDWLRSLLGASFVPALSWAFGLAVVFGLFALWPLIRRVRRSGRSLVLWPWVLAGLLILVILRSWSSGEASIDAVERVHLLEYGLLSALFFAAFRRRLQGVAVLLTTLLATFGVGLVDETVQWLSPARVGDVRDTVLNFWAAWAGLLVGWGIAEPRSGTSFWRLDVPARRWVGGLAGAVLMIGTVFGSSAHLGSRVEDPEVGSFLSYFDKAELMALQAERRGRWQKEVPTLAPYTLEDRYWIEAGRHVQERNTAWEREDRRIAWLENRILERFYDPVLDLRPPRGGPAHRWVPEHRAELEIYRPATGVAAGYRSPVQTDRLRVWPYGWPLWALTLPLAALCLAIAVAGRVFPSRRRREGEKKVEERG